MLGWDPATCWLGDLGHIPPLAHLMLDFTSSTEGVKHSASAVPCSGTLHLHLPQLLGLTSLENLKTAQGQAEQATFYNQNVQNHVSTFVTL